MRFSRVRPLNVEFIFFIFFSFNHSPMFWVFEPLNRFEIAGFGVEIAGFGVEIAGFGVEIAGFEVEIAGFGI